MTASAPPAITLASVLPKSSMPTSGPEIMPWSQATINVRPSGRKIRFRRRVTKRVSFQKCGMPPRGMLSPCSAPVSVSIRAIWAQICWWLLRLRVSVSASIRAICAQICWRPLRLRVSVSVSIRAICAQICWRLLCLCSMSMWAHVPLIATLQIATQRTGTGAGPYDLPARTAASFLYATYRAAYNLPASASGSR